MRLQTLLTHSIVLVYLGSLVKECRDDACGVRIKGLEIKA